MLKKRLSSWNQLSRSGIARARFTDAGLRLWLTYGRAVFTNGRIWLRVIGAASLTNGSTALFALFRDLKAGLRESRLGRITPARVFTFCSVRAVVLSVPGRRATAADTVWFSLANARKSAFDRCTRAAIWGSLFASVAVRCRS